MKKNIHVFSAWITVFKNTVWFVFGTCALVAAVGGFLAVAFGWVPLYVAGVLVAIGIGIIAGISIHRGYAFRRNAPLGYRVESQEMHLTMDSSEARKWTRTLARSIVSKKDFLYILDGLYRYRGGGSMKFIQTEGQGFRQIVETAYSDDGWRHYTIWLARVLSRNEPANVTIIQEVVDADWSMSPELTAGTRSPSSQLTIGVRIASNYLIGGSVQLLEEKLAGVETLKATVLPLVVEDYVGGVFTGIVPNPKLGYRYAIRWRWSDAYADRV